MRYNRDMKKTAMIRARMEPELKEKAENLFAQLGLSTTDAIGLFFRRALQKNGLPFEISLPNDETLEAIDEIERGEGTKFSSSQELFDDLGI